MNSHERHQKKFETRIQVIKMLNHRGMRLSKTGNLFQVVKENLGSVFQSHNIDEIKEWITHQKGLFTKDLPVDNSIDNRRQAVKYTKILIL